MPLVWSGALDLVGQIWCYLGFFFVALLFQRLEQGARERATVSFNKAMARGHLLVWNRCATNLLPAGLGGEGAKRKGGSFSTSRSWRLHSRGFRVGIFLLSSLGGEVEKKSNSGAAGRGKWRGNLAADESFPTVVLCRSPIHADGRQLSTPTMRRLSNL